MDFPLISCIMPTIGRRHSFAKQAVNYFNEQDYPRKELIIVDESDDPQGYLTGAFVPRQENIHCVTLHRRAGANCSFTIGAKRNLACSLATGDIIAHWDDDDYYRADRLSRQVAPILAGRADITGIAMECVFHIPSWRAWRCSPTLHQEIFANDVHGGTLMYNKNLWGAHTSFANISSGEDGRFLLLVRSHGADLAKVENGGSFVYIRHEEHNVWPLPPHEYLHMEEWKQVPIEQYLTKRVMAFYSPLRKG